MKLVTAISLTLMLLVITVAFTGAFDSAASDGTFHISQWNGSKWEEVHQHQFGIQYSTETFAVNAADGQVKLRIVQNNMPFADIDQIKLEACGTGLIPEYARYVADNQDILSDILEIDHNVVLAHEQEIEVCWQMLAGCEDATLSLNANEYGYGYPLEFPWTGWASYEMGSNPGSITVDGIISETDGTAPLYSPMWKSSSGHPEGYTHIYVCDDTEKIYFSLDITSDNTCEFGEDWAEITIMTTKGTIHKFQVDDFNDTWGRSGFGITSKVSYKHQTYEFSIPKDIVGNDDIEFRLRYYGTEVAIIPIGQASDAGGIMKYFYTPADIVYVTGSDFPPQTMVEIIVVPNRTWTDGDPIPPDITDSGTITVITDIFGNIPPTQVWGPPLEIGEYDVIFDWYTPTGGGPDGFYAQGYDPVDDPNHPGFVVIMPGEGGSPIVGGQVTLVNKSAIIAQWIALPIRLMIGLVL